MIVLLLHNNEKVCFVRSMLWIRIAYVKMTLHDVCRLMTLLRKRKSGAIGVNYFNHLNFCLLEILDTQQPTFRPSAACIVDERTIHTTIMVVANNR
jgi:hypothetical protein